MATTGIGFLILEIEQRYAQIERQKERLKTEEEELSTLRSKLKSMIKELVLNTNSDDDDLVSIQLTHAGRTRIFRIDRYGVFKEEAYLIKL